MGLVHVGGTLKKKEKRKKKTFPLEENKKRKKKKSKEKLVLGIGNSFSILVQNCVSPTPKVKFKNQIRE